MNPSQGISGMQIQRYGETALLLQLDETHDEHAVNSIAAINRRLANSELRGVRSTTPSYASLLVIFDPQIISAHTLASTILDLLHKHREQQAPEEQDSLQTRWSLPTRFADDNDEDAVALQNELELSWRDIVETFCAVSYRVNALGFLPGFTYLGGLPGPLQCRRLVTPRVRIPSSSVAIAGNQAGIYPMDSPGGWRILGRLPFTIFNAARPSPALFAPNDQITFIPVSQSHFDELAVDATRGDLDMRQFQQ